MDLSPYAKAGELIAVHIRERTIAGGLPGVVLRCVLELEWATGERTLVEQAFDEETAPNLASFEASIQVLNRVLARKRAGGER
jgi:hypothetical protein